MLEVINLADGDVLPNPLCLLRVTGTPDDVNIATITNFSDNRSNESTFNVNCNEFNALILLNVGNNCLKIVCGYEELIINVEYEPITNPRFVRIVYITCLNEEKFQGPKDIDRNINSAIKRIRTGILLLQTFLAETLMTEGLGRKTFRLERDKEGYPVVHVLQLPLTISEAQKLSEERLWEIVAMQILSSYLADKKCKYVAFFNGTRFLNPEKKVFNGEKEMMKNVKGQVSLGGGGLALVGTGALYTWASDISGIIKGFMNNSPIDSNTLMDFSAGRGTWGACFGTHLGSVMHELAHTMDLGHTSYGIMERGFEDLHIFFTKAKIVEDHLTESSYNKSTLKPSMSSSLIKESVTFNTDLVQRIPVNSMMTVEPPKEPFASCGVYNTYDQYKSNPSTSKHSQMSSNESYNSFPQKGNLTSPVSGSSTSDSNNIFLHNNDSQSKEVKCRAVWARSNAVLLSYHRWLNHVTDGQPPELKGSVLLSCAGVRVVELRNMRTMAFHHWEFVTCPPPPVLHLQWTKVKNWPPDSHIEVVAQDDHGNVLKGKFIPRPL